jgi:hypothetical protein
MSYFGLRALGALVEQPPFAICVSLRTFGDVLDHGCRSRPGCRRVVVGAVMPTLMASFAIRGACVMISGTFAEKLAVASCTFGWLPFAAHQR